jgi:DNA primase
VIDPIALLHQFQRPVKSATVGGQSIEYIEVTVDDIEAANRLAHEVLGRSLDELPPQTRRVLAALHSWVEGITIERELRRPDVRFTRSDVRRVTSLSDVQCRVHVERLVALEYVLVHRGTRGQSFEYELLYDGQGGNGAPFVAGLIEVEALKSNTTTASSRGKTGQFAGASRPQNGVDAAPTRTGKYEGEPDPVRSADESAVSDRKTHPLSAGGKIVSYAHLSLAAATVLAG